MATRKDFHTWTEDEEERLLAMRESGLGYDDIGIAFGLSRGAVASRLEKLRAEGRAERIAPVRPHRYVDPALLAERDARKAAYDRRDLTAAFCGDPPRGFSELDKREGRA